MDDVMINIYEYYRKCGEPIKEVAGEGIQWCDVWIKMVEANRLRHNTLKSDAHETNGVNSLEQDLLEDLVYIPVKFEATEGDDFTASVYKIVYTLKKEWGKSKQKLKIEKFTDGITNTLLKVSAEGGTENEALLLRAYGAYTDILINRGLEMYNHALLSKYNLAPKLLAKFTNGLLYEFLPGRVCKAEDLSKPCVYRAVARRMAEYHAKLPTMYNAREIVNGSTEMQSGNDMRCITVCATARGTGTGTRCLTHNIWNVLRSWVEALPCGNDGLEKKLAGELPWLEERLQLPDENVFAHADLLSGNIIILPRAATHILSYTDPRAIHAGESGKSESKGGDDVDDVHVAFIDYEYAVFAPAAFDIANHFSEWGGFSCSVNALPDRAQRQDFLSEYMAAYDYYTHYGSQTCLNTGSQHAVETNLARLFSQVDLYRGLPGLYWGVWALIQARISRIAFDYEKYAQVRLAEYWDWKAAYLRDTDPADASAAANAKVGNADAAREVRWRS